VSQPVEKDPNVRTRQAATVLSAGPRKIIDTRQSGFGGQVEPEKSESKVWPASHPRYDALGRGFVNASGILLLVVALLKVGSLVGGHGMLSGQDPVFEFLTRNELMALATLLELAIGAFLLFANDRPIWARLGIIAWLSTVFGAYRLSLSLMGYSGSCGCLGNVLNHTASKLKTERVLVTTVLLLLIVFSYVLLLIYWLINRGGRAKLLRP
jgi:hypothetical protein